MSKVKGKVKKLKAAKAKTGSMVINELAEGYNSVGPAQGGATITFNDYDRTRIQFRLEALRIARGAADGAIAINQLCADAQSLIEFLEQPQVVSIF